MDQLPVTSPPRLIADLLDARHDGEHVAPVAADCVDRGLATGDELASAAAPYAQAYVGRRPYERFHVDLVTGTPLAALPEYASPLLSVDIPGLARPHYRVYPLAGVVADKVCAITERPSDRPSTRFRDLIDLTLIARSQPLDAPATSEALATELLRRGLTPVAGTQLPRAQHP